MSMPEPSIRSDNGEWGVGSLHLSKCVLAMSLDTGVLFVHWIVVAL